jgi:hypothetical protein
MYGYGMGAFDGHGSGGTAWAPPPQHFGGVADFGGGENQTTATNSVTGSMWEDLPEELLLRESNDHRDLQVCVLSCFRANMPVGSSCK